MPILTLLTTTVIPWVAKEIFDTYKEKYISPGLKNLLFTSDEYTIELNKVITNTIEKYQEVYPPNCNFPFYHHKETFAQLSKFILFKDEGKNILESINFNEIENIDKPTSEQLEQFYNYFIGEIQSNDKLKGLYIEENYKSKIFEIYREISLIKNIIEDFIKAIPKSDAIIKGWIDMIYGNLQKLKSSTALEEINRFETEFLPLNQISDRNKAFMYFVKGLCLNENIKPVEAIAYFEQACVLDQENQSYKAWYLYLMYLFNKSEKVLSDVTAATRISPFDSLLNSISTMEILEKNPVFTPQAISLSVQNNIRYKRVIYRYYLNKNMVAPALDYFQIDKENVNEQIKEVSIDNYSYLDFYLQLYFIQTLTKYPNNLFFVVNPELRNSTELQTCINNFETFREKIKDSEKKLLKDLYEYLYQIASFLKDGDKNHLNTAYSLFQQSKDIISPLYFNLLKFGFSQSGDFETALKIFNEKENSAEEYFFMYVLYNKQNDKANGIKSLLNYIKNIKTIDDNNITITLDSILNRDILISDLELFYENLLNNTISTNGIYRDILMATKGVKDEANKEASVKMLENNFKTICEEENKEIINSYCRLLHCYDLWQGIVTILGDKEIISFEGKTLLIEALWYSKLNAPKLLKLLEELRSSNFPQFDQYYLWEINHNCLLGSWEKVREISEKGRSLFPVNKAFDYYLAVSLINLDKKTEFCALLSEVSILDFKYSNFQMLIQGLIQFEEYIIAVEHTYNYTLKNSDPNAKMFFFNTFLFNYEKVLVSLPLYCESGYLVKIESEQKSILVNEKDHKNIFDKLIGKRVGESIFLPATMTGKEVEYKIKGILHKYDVLLGEIQKEAENPELSGLPMQAFKLMEGGTLEEWNKQLVDLFGKSGDERHIFIEKSVNDYKNGQTSFLQLTRVVFNDDILDAYLTVANSPEVGYRVTSHTLFKKINHNTFDGKICLDLPTALSFSIQSQKLNIPNNKKFIISKHAVEYIEGLTQIVEKAKGSELSLNITSKGVVPFLDKKKVNEQKIDILNKCKEWISQNCETQTSSEKLNFLVHFQSSNTTPNSFILSYIDSISLSIENNYLLISDEKIAFAILREKELIASSEWYLKNFVVPKDPDLIYGLLSESNYIGIEIPASQISKITNILISESKEQENILQNLSIKSSANTINILILARVMEEILNSQTTEPKKIEILQKLLQNLFDGIYGNQSLLQNVIDLVRLSLFQLFQRDNTKYQIITKELFTVLANNNVNITIK